jgi:uncharacterized repeat protein (TIGR03803 family)
LPQLGGTSIISLCDGGALREGGIVGIDNRMFPRFWRSEPAWINSFWRGLMVLVTVAMAGMAPWHGAHAYTFKVLHEFCAKTNCPDGEYPDSPLIMDGAGNLYGTTYVGGAKNYGTVFELVPNPKTGKWSEKLLYSFCAVKSPDCGDGIHPEGRLVMDGGNLYGVAQGGGAQSGGAVFELVLNKATGKWIEKVLYSFCAKSNCTDGQYPAYGPIMDASGNLYGTTPTGGTAGGGTVYELVWHPNTGKWTEKVLHSFGSHANDLLTPNAGLIMDSAGTLYGTAFTGGNASTPLGGFFKLTFDATKKYWTERSIHNIGAPDPQYEPTGGVIMDCGPSVNGVYGCTGNLIGQTENTVLKFTPDGTKTSWTEDVLYTFCPVSDCSSDLGFGPYGGLIMDGKGNLFGSNGAGGTGAACNFGEGCGAAFELFLNSTRTQVTGYKVLHTFCSYGGGPYGQCNDGTGGTGLFMDKLGNLYGVSGGGGTVASCYNIDNGGCGLVFELVK